MSNIISIFLSTATDFLKAKSRIRSWWRYKFITRIILSGILAIAFSGITPWLYVPKANAHSVAQIQTTKYLAPETVNLLKTRATSGGTAGLQQGDIISYIIQFSPVANGNVAVGAGGYVTDYIPAGSQVVGAAIVQPDGNGNYINVAPDLPGTISNGWGPRNQQTYNASWTTADSTYLAACSGVLTTCNGSLAQIYADTGIFFSTDARTQVNYATDNDGIIKQGTNGYNVSPTAENQLNPIIGQSNATTHNQWDADQTNAFGSTQAAITGTTGLKSTANSISSGQGAAPYNAGSAVAGKGSGFKLDNTGTVGPWQRIAYPGSRIGNPTGRATSATTSAGDPLNSNIAIVGNYTSTGWNLSESNPLPPDTNAVRWALGRLVPGQTRYSKVTLKLNSPPASSGFINNSEVFGGDSAQAGGYNGNDNPWRYHVPSVAQNNSNLFLLKEVIKVNGQPANGELIPANAKITYRVTYLNTGNSAQNNVVLSDTLPCQTAANSVSNINTQNTNPPLNITLPSLTAGNCGTTPTAGATFSAAPVTLNPGTGGVVEFDVQTNATASYVVNRAKLASQQLPTGITSNAVSTVATITPADLAITKTDNLTVIKPNNSITYTIAVKNNGSSNVTGATVTDIVPSAITGVSWTCTATASSSCGAANGTGNNISTTVNLINGGTATYTISGTVDANATGTLENTATVSAPVGISDSNSGNNTALDTTKIIGARLVLVKRITAINGNRTQNPHDSTVALNTVIDDPGTTNDNDPKWLSGYLVGAINGKNVYPEDVIEYTIYFLSNGITDVTNMRFCDLVPANTNFVTDAFNGLTPTDGGSSTNVNYGMALAIGSTTPTAYLTNEDDAPDRGRFFAAGTTPSASCSASNTNGAVIVNIATSPAILAKATSAGSPNNSYGFIRFQTRVN